MKVLIDDQDLDLIFVAAFRYALGRRSYMVLTVADFIKTNISLIPQNIINLMIREITEAEQNHNDGLYKALGDDCDVETWLSLREFLNNYVKKAFS